MSAQASVLTSEFRREGHFTGCQIPRTAEQVNVLRGQAVPQAEAKEETSPFPS